MTKYGFPNRCWARRLRLAGVVFAYLLSGIASGEEPTPPPGTPLVRPATLEEVDATLAELREQIARLPEVLNHPPADHTGRRLEQDVAEILSPQTQSRLRQLREELQASMPEGSSTVTFDELKPLAELQLVQVCRAMVLGTYWQQVEARDFQRAQLRAQIELQPAEERASLLAQIAGIDARALLIRQKALALTSNECATEQFRSRIGSEAMTGVMEFNNLRQRITNLGSASPLDDARAPWLQRKTACPVPVEGTTGNPMPKLHHAPDVTDYYPEQTRKFNVEGIVRVAVEIDSSGCARSARLERSSGVQLLDEAGVLVALEMQFIPGGGEGQPIGSRVVIPIRFNLPHLHE